MFGPKIEITKELQKRLADAAALTGASSPQELAVTILERELQRILGSGTGAGTSSEDVADIERKLKGLGYLE